MKNFFENHRRACIIGGICFSAAVFAVYLLLLFMPGYWHYVGEENIFLRKTAGAFEEMEVYSGKDILGNKYELVMLKEGNTAYMAFTANEEEKYYEITSNNSENHRPAVRIVENGKEVFRGTAHLFGDEYALADNNGEFFTHPFEISFAGETAEEPELFPSCGWLYNVSVSVKADTFGEPVMLIFIVFCAAFLAVDILFPDFFWHLRNWADVKGGEPSEFYRFSQKILRIGLAVIIIGAMIMSFIKI